MNNTTIGALVSTTRQISTAAHGVANLAPPLVLARGAFLSLIRLNIWGIATLLSKKAFLVDAATTARQTAPNMWWDLQKKWRNGWWNLGGNWDKFVSAVNAGKVKKALGFKLAPKGIKEKLRSQGIGGYDTVLGSVDEQQGIGVTLEAVVAAAGGIILALEPILKILFNNVKNDLPSDSFDEIKKDNIPPPTEDTAGYGLIGVAVLAALYLGTQSKTPTRRRTTVKK